ncbi:MAG TPA: type III-A CRISPR-associated protein Csm2 [Clostridiales bacterium]|nr:type III-A CRISPR-associated protein Csm2 [Clostridiales bacterium]
MTGRRQGKNFQQQRRNPIQDLISEIRNANSLKEVFTPEEYALPDGWAHKTAKRLSKQAMNSNQLRKIFTQLKSIEEKIDRNKNNELTDAQINEILLIMPQIAYAKGRDLIPWEFYDLMKECITPKKLKDKDDFKSFVNFYTAVVAYSKV